MLTGAGDSNVERKSANSLPKAACILCVKACGSGVIGFCD